MIRLNITDYLWLIMNNKSQIVGVTECENSEKKSHVFFAKQDESLCGNEVRSEDTDILPDYVQISSRADDICKECKEEYDKWLENGGNREPTTKCTCDSMTTAGPERCEKVVSAYKARELSHPARKRSLPVCPTCYRWIKSLNTNSVDTEYSEATPWLQKRKPESLDEISE